MTAEIDQFVALILAHQWLALAIVAIGLAMRLLKTELVQSWLRPIPPRYRPLVALGLGAASGILEAIAAGTPWLEALLRGLLAAGIAMAGHDVIIEGLLGGREGRALPPKGPS